MEQVSETDAVVRIKTNEGSIIPTSPCHENECWRKNGRFWCIHHYELFQFQPVSEIYGSFSSYMLCCKKNSSKFILFPAVLSLLNTLVEYFGLDQRPSTSFILVTKVDVTFHFSVFSILVFGLYITSLHSAWWHCSTSYDFKWPHLIRQQFIAPALKPQIT